MALIFTRWAKNLKKGIQHLGILVYKKGYMYGVNSLLGVVPCILPTSSVSHSQPDDSRENSNLAAGMREVATFRVSWDFKKSVDIPTYRKVIVIKIETVDGNNESFLKISRVMKKTWKDSEFPLLMRDFFYYSTNFFNPKIICNFHHDIILFYLRVFVIKVSLNIKQFFYVLLNRRVCL